MNYLAHAYLSFNDKEILMGNMMSDFIKGKQQFTYPTVIHKGIILHRCIDNFTDAHEATRTAKEVFRADYRLYSGAFIDVIYDHFLANDVNEFPTEASLWTFSQGCYSTIDAQREWMPPRFGKMFFYMKTQDWLSGYRSIAGTILSFGGLVRRAAYLQDAYRASEIFENNYELLATCYRQFWKELKLFSFNKMNELINK